MTASNLRLERTMIEVEFSRDLSRDLTQVRLREWFLDDDGKRRKRGVIINVKDEDLHEIPEAGQYPERNLE